MAAALTSLKPFENRAHLASVIDAISSIDNDVLLQKSGGEDLSLLSPNTVFDSVEAFPETVFESGIGRFEASAIVYVTLNYGGKRDHVSMPDSFPAVVKGTIASDGSVDVSEIKIDTSSFYE